MQSGGHMMSAKQDPKRKPLEPRQYYKQQNPAQGLLKVIEFLNRACENADLHSVTEKKPNWLNNYSSEWLIKPYFIFGIKSHCLRKPGRVERWGSADFLQINTIW